MTIIGYDFFGINTFESISSSVNNINYVECTKSIIDEINIRERIDIENTNIKENWKTDNLMLCRFQNTLEAGNVDNNSLKISKFIIKRRKLDELDNTILGYKDYVNDSDIIYIDNTQANDDYIYSIVPLAENGIEGKTNEVVVQSDFTGWHVCDKTDINNYIACDKFISGEPDVGIKRNEGRIVLESFSKFPHVFKTPKKYHEFSLTCTILIDPSLDSGNTYNEYKKILTMIDSGKPFIVKSANGDIYICEISNPRKNSPLNMYRGRDYVTVEFDCLEIMSEADYQKLYVGGDV